MHSDVLIVGACPTDLVLALWLSKLGVKVRVFDKTTEPRTTSRALAVQARTLELYRQLDLAGAVVKHGHKVPAVIGRTSRALAAPGQAARAAADRRRSASRQDRRKAGALEGVRRALLPGMRRFAGPLRTSCQKSIFRQKARASNSLEAADLTSASSN
jgi:2-polyprenyl-6-methoxyphenol hydroxylase-like FAD-dependent oxidoreductase